MQAHAYYAATPTANKFTTTVTANKKSYGAGESIENYQARQLPTKKDASFQ